MDSDIRMNSYAIGCIASADGKKTAQLGAAIMRRIRL